jgi:hypothetical protein
MKQHSLSWSGVRTVLSQNKLALLGGVLFCLAPVTATAQGVSFAGAQSVPPAKGLAYPGEVAVDSAGDAFISDWGTDLVVELPRTATGFGAQVTLPFSGLDGPYGVTVDSEGDVFVADDYNRRVVELPWAGTSYGAQLTLPFSGGQPISVAVDSARNVFVVSENPENVVELPWTGSGYGSQTTLPFSVSYPLQVAVDSERDVFVSDWQSSRVVELPWTGTGYGTQVALPTTGLNFPGGVAVDSKGDVFIVGGADSGYPPSVVELPWTGTEYGPLTTLPFSGLGTPTPGGVAVDGAGNVFEADAQNHRVVELQTQSVGFGSPYACAAGYTTPVPCSQTLTLDYNLTANGTLGTPQVLTGGAPNLDFTLASGSTCIGALTAGSTCTVNVTFAPQATGTRNGAVEVVDGSGTVLTTTPIYGRGVPAADAPPVAQLSATTLKFGTISYGTTKTLPLTITNIGGGTITVAPSIDGQNFIIAGNNCTGKLTDGELCTLQIEFSPLFVGGSQEFLTVQINGSTNQIVILDGNSNPSDEGGAAKALVSTNYLSFTAPLGGSSEVLGIVIYNIGGRALTVTPSISTYSGRPSSIYKVTSNTCADVTSTGSCSLQIEFSPTSITNYDDLLTLQTNGATNPTVNLVGASVGLSVLGGVSGGTLKFGSVSSGSTEVLPLTVTNVRLPGTVTIGTAITVRATTHPTTTYKILTTAQNTCLAGITAGQSCTLPIEFAPTSSGVHDDVLTLTPSAGGGSTNLWLIGSTP